LDSLIPEGSEAGGYWDRPFFELFEWGMIEPEKGLFDFRMTDEYVRRAQRYGFHALANIQPFAYWDQDLCHSDLPGIKSPRGRQNRFIEDDRVIYVLWGKGKLPSEIKGEVRLTDISGNEEIITPESIRLTSSPVFIEIIE